jgi:hypothetical protein
MKLVWKTLNYDIWDNAIGNSMICRLRIIKNSSIGVGIFKGLDMPIYDRYFILEPSQKAARDRSTGQTSSPLQNNLINSSKKGSSIEIIKQINKQISGVGTGNNTTTNIPKLRKNKRI